MKTITSTLPWVVVLAVAGAGIWWMLSREMTLGKWLLGGLLLAHGAVHFLYALPESETGPDWPFNMEQSWAITSPGLVRGLGWTLIGLAFLGFLLAALATIGIVVPAAWWQATVVAGAVASTLALVLFFDPQLAAGITINAILLWVVIGTSASTELIAI